MGWSNLKLWAIHFELFLTLWEWFHVQIPLVQRSNAVSRSCMPLMTYIFDSFFSVNKTQSIPYAYLEKMTILSIHFSRLIVNNLYKYMYVWKFNSGKDSTVSLLLSIASPRETLWRHGERDIGENPISIKWSQIHWKYCSWSYNL